MQQISTIKEYAIARQIKENTQGLANPNSLILMKPSILKVTKEEVAE